MRSLSSSPSPTRLGCSVALVLLVIATQSAVQAAQALHKFGAESRAAQVSRAIEMTKRRQSAAAHQPPPLLMQQRTGNSPTAIQQRPGRTETLDVERLNKLIRAIDKTWIMPREGAKEPVGSNFQYKKTCASIFKARHGACQQLGFGVMCFNYCHERGEKLSFRCQDASDASYCRASSNFDTFLAKYRKDGYKAKAFVHQVEFVAFPYHDDLQMISRCYATAICNVQSGILNSTMVDETPEEAAARANNTTKGSRWRVSTIAPGGGGAVVSNKKSIAGAATRTPLLTKSTPAGGKLTTPPSTAPHCPADILSGRPKTTSFTKKSAETAQQPDVFVPTPNVVAWPWRNLRNVLIIDGPISTTSRRRPTCKTKAATKRRRPSSRTRSSAISSTTASVTPRPGRTNIWDRFTVGQKTRTTPKFVPFWQKLLTTTATTTSKRPDDEEESSGGEEPTTTPVDSNEEDEDNEDVDEKSSSASSSSAPSTTFKQPFGFRLSTSAASTTTTTTTTATTTTDEDDEDLGESEEEKAPPTPKKSSVEENEEEREGAEDEEDEEEGGVGEIEVEEIETTVRPPTTRRMSALHKLIEEQRKKSIKGHGTTASRRSVATKKPAATKRTRSATRTPVTTTTRKSRPASAAQMQSKQIKETAKKATTSPVVEQTKPTFRPISSSAAPVVVTTKTETTVVAQTPSSTTSSAVDMLPTGAGGASSFGVSTTSGSPGFWNRFQPGRWFQSVHYMTNTGRRRR